MSMKKRTKWIVYSLAGLVVLFILLKVTGVFGKDKGIKVTAEAVAQRTIIQVVNASGKIYPEVEVRISPDISGEITELTVQEGDTVKKGQLLARIYADVYNIQRNQAATGVDQSQAQVAMSQAQVANSKAALGALEAQRDQAQKTYNMQKQLFNEKVISQSEFNVAESNYRSAVANYNAAVQGIRSGEASIKSARAGVQNARENLARANTDLGRTAIVAPMDGVVSLLSVKKGEKVAGNSFNVGTEILRIADMDKIEVRVDVGENDVPKVKLGDSALVDIDAYNGRKFKGIVTQIASSNNGAAAQSALAGATGSTDVTQYKVYVRLLKNSYADLLGKGSFPFRPGMSANVDIQTQVKQNAISVPINAVTTREKDDSITKATVTDGATNMDDVDILVFVLDSSNKVSKAKVTTGIQDINYIEITSGLKSGQKVITGPYDVVSKTLKPKDEVKVVDKKELFEKKE